MAIVLMIVLLSILILVHEAGHFLSARAFGIKVEKFGFGLPIGPTLWKKQVGDIEILVHAFLLGGYVSFPDDEKDCDLPQDSPERFTNKPKWQRAVVISAGVFANAICALLLVLLVAIYTHKLPSDTFDIYINKIDAPKTASIWISGAQEGDRIVKANNCVIKNTYSLVTIIKNSAKSNGTVTQKTVDENFKKLKKLNPALEKDEVIPVNIAVRLPEEKSTSVVTMDKYAAQGAKNFKVDGIKIDDNIKSLENTIADNKIYISDGKYTLYDIAKAMSDGVHPVVITVDRNGKQITLKPIYPSKTGSIGIKLEQHQKFVETKGIKSIIVESNKYLYNKTYLMIYSLGQLFTGGVSMSDMHGIILITKIGGDIIQHSGFSQGMLLAALISMNLAILNFLPIPALDGGHIMFLIIEAITGKEVDEKIVEKISSVFFMLLLGLMVFVLYNDIAWIIKK